MNAIQKALVEAGLVEEPKERRKRPRKYNCRRCGAEMVRVDGTNIMACSNDKCKNFFIFDKVV